MASDSTLQLTFKNWHLLHFGVELIKDEYPLLSKKGYYNTTPFSNYISV